MRLPARQQLANTQVQFLGPNYRTCIWLFLYVLLLGCDFPDFLLATDEGQRAGGPGSQSTPDKDIPGPVSLQLCSHSTLGIIPAPIPNHLSGIHKPSLPSLGPRNQMYSGQKALFCHRESLKVIALEKQVFALLLFLICCGRLVICSGQTTLFILSSGLLQSH